MGSYICISKFCLWKIHMWTFIYLYTYITQIPTYVAWANTGRQNAFICEESSLTSFLRAFKLCSSFKLYWCQLWFDGFSVMSKRSNGCCSSGCFQFSKNTEAFCDTEPFSSWWPWLLCFFPVLMSVWLQLCWGQNIPDILTVIFLQLFCLLEFCGKITQWCKLPSFQC